MPVCRVLPIGLGTALALAALAACSAPRANLADGPLGAGSGGTGATDTAFGGALGSGGNGGSTGATPPGLGGQGGVPAGPDAPMEACASGRHRCGGGCVDDMSPQSCGTSCEACPPVEGGTPTCDGKTCGRTCPAGKRLCLDGCVDESKPCGTTCTAGKNLCNGSCVAPTSVNACGPSCVACPTSVGGEATCDGFGGCTLNCLPGFHKCGGACFSNASPATCGSSCIACVPPVGGTVFCDSVTCRPACPSGLTLCGVTCVDLQSNANHCGTCDNACPAECGSGTCRCPTPSSANLLVNGGINKSTEPWTFYEDGPQLTWRSEDAGGCTNSGSMLVHSNVPVINAIAISYQCVPVKPGTTYNIGVWIKEPGNDSGEAKGSYEIGWFPQANCGGDAIGWVTATNSPGTASWTHIFGQGVAPANARTARVQIEVYRPGSEAIFDMAYMSPAPARF